VSMGNAIKEFKKLLQIHNDENESDVSEVKCDHLILILTIISYLVKKDSF
jgi:hypothetical protein